MRGGVREEEVSRGVIRYGKRGEEKVKDEWGLMECGLSSILPLTLYPLSPKRNKLPSKRVQTQHFTSIYKGVARIFQGGFSLQKFC